MNWHLGEILIQDKYITWDQLGEALEEQKQDKALIGEILVRKGFLSRQLLYRALAKKGSLRFIDPFHIRINPKAIERIPRSIAEKYSLLPVDIQQDVLFIAIGDPLQKWPEQEIKQMAKVQEIRKVLCLPEDIRQLIRDEYGGV